MDQLKQQLEARLEDLTKSIRKIQLPADILSDCPYCGNPMKSKSFGDFEFATCDCPGYRDASSRHRDLREKIFQVEAELETLEMAEENRKRRAKKIAEEIGDAFARKTFEEYDTAGREDLVGYVKKFASEFPEVDRPGMVLSGNVGTGKTHLASAAARKIAERKSVGYYNAGTLLRTIRSSYRDSSRYDEKEIFGAVTGCDLLVLDDLGRDRKTEWSEDILFQVIDRIYTAGTGLIVTTNLTRRGLEEYLGEAAYSRIFGMSRFLIFTGEDYRQKERRHGTKER